MNQNNTQLLIVSIFAIILMILLFYFIKESNNMMRSGGVIGKPGFIASSGCNDGERCCADKDGDYVCVRGWWTYMYFQD